MNVEQRVRQLLEELLDSEHTPEEVCRACPELLSQVRMRWQQKLACDARLDAFFPAPEPALAFVDPSTPRLSPDLPQIPGHDVHEILGQGGMGVVYMAWHRLLHRPVAVKMQLAGSHANPKSQERFLREAEAVASLRHPNIVQVHDMGDQDGLPYFTMEFVEGGNLAQKLAGLPQPLRQSASLVAILADAVDAAHRNGIVHRDLKPSNVLLTTDGTPKISDFGLARRMDEAAGLTGTGTVIGTPSYMAPEQAEARQFSCGPAVDIYSLGAILYELLTGRPPFRAESAAETVRQVLYQDPVPPSRIEGKVSRDLETICLKCLNKDPQLRYPSALELAADLRRFLAGEAITARPDGRIAKLARRVRRRPALSAAIAAGILLTVVLLGGGLWLVSDRARVASKAVVERVATELAAGKDLQEMAQWLKTSSWTEARAALERARGRLGDRGSGGLHRLLAQGTHDLEVVAQLEAIRMDATRSLLRFDRARSDEQYEEAFSGAGIGPIHDDPGVVVNRVRASNIQKALVAALDDWSGFTDNPRRKDWVLEVARKSDPTPSAWRDRARDPAVQADGVALIEVIKAAPIADQSAPLLLTLDRRLNPASKERLPFLKRIHLAHPEDFWVNQTVGEVLLRENKPEEAIGYYQSAVSIRPGMALSHHYLGYALLATQRMEEAVRQLRQAAAIEPTYFLSQQLLASALSELGRHDEAIDQLRVAIRLNPAVAGLHTELGRSLEVRGRDAEALAEHQQALALDPKNSDVQKGLRNILVRMGRSGDAQIAWQSAIQADPDRYVDWCEYAGFCLFIGQEEEYRRTRRTLLARFGTSTDPFVAEETARACLLLPSTDNELSQIATLANRAMTVDRSEQPWVYPFAVFVKGFAEFRQGKLDRATTTLTEDTTRVLGPAPQIVLAMTLHQRGQAAEARNLLAAAIVAYDWRAIRVRAPTDWIMHTLRREAEQMILPSLPAFLAGTYEPRDNDERLALLGVCQFTNRAHAMARLYADAFAFDSQVAMVVGPLHRYAAVRAAGWTGSGWSEDRKTLSEAERMRWRKQAHDWLELELAALASKLDGGAATDRHLVWRTLAYWLADPALAGVREPLMLKKLSAGEREEWLALWKDIDGLFNRSSSL